MEATQNDSQTALPSDGLVPLESVLCTEELNRRPSRPPDYEAVNRALAALVQALADSPGTILQTLAETILEVFQSGSAGLSLLTKDEKRFYWPAIAGAWKPHIGGGTPRDFGPCGDVLDRNLPLLFRHAEQRYTYLLPVTPPLVECLLVPFYVEGKAVGTIWAIAHDERRKFDLEDLRQLESLGRFASAAYQAVEVLDVLKQQSEALRQSHTEIAGRMAELQQSNTEARESRRAALNLMEDAVQSSQAMERANAELHESEERFRSLVSIITDVPWVTDATGAFVTPQPAWEAHTGQSWEEHRGFGWANALHPADRESVKEIWQRACESRRLYQSEGRVWHAPTQQWRYFVGKATPLLNTDGSVREWIGTCTDVDEQKRAHEWLANTVAERTKELHESNLALLRDMEERKKLEEQLLHAQKMESIGTLAGGVAHDFNNLLAIIMAHAAELKNDGLKPEEFSESLDAILTASQRGAAVVRELLAFARKTSVSRDNLKLADLLPEFAHMIERTLPKTIELELNLSADLPAIQANANQIQQALLNLCVNSRDAMPEGGKLAIGAAREMRSEAGAGDYVRVSVADTGFGMDEEVRTRVFDPFFTTKEKQGGTGLGLAVTYGIVRNHGGFVEVESARGKGTEFRLYFPVHSENASLKEGELGQ